ncbi:MAG: M28 family peptidase [Thermaurantimonas sp.]|uniref:M28 family peptidase n=1 Tax=Thermaurantimonas sp. TaxID=2681568 RepID=UPI00391AD110
MKKSLIVVFAFSFSMLKAQSDELAEDIKKIFYHALTTEQSYEWLRSLCKDVGPRMAGSPGDRKAVEWSVALMKKLNFDTVYTLPVNVRHWERGRESAIVRISGKKIPLNVTALGGSVSTGKRPLRAEVIEVRDFDHLKELGERVRGKIVFYNYRMRKDYISTGAGYGDAVKYRWSGAVEASKYGAVAVLIRSVTTRADDYTHTGVMTYEGADVKIPAGALSYVAADRLEQILRQHQTVSIDLTLESFDRGRTTSHNVIGEIYGTDRPNEVLIAGGHLDSWDLGEGAHDDGAGVVHSIAAAAYLRQLGIPTRRTVRVVLFANEEFGLDGAKQYASWVKDHDTKIIRLAVESDGGGLSPRGFTLDAPDSIIQKVRSYRELFYPYGMYEMGRGGSGADVNQLKSTGAVLAGLRVDGHRYFDLHHTSRDVFEEVNPRELEMGSAAMAAFVLLFDKLIF